MKIITNITDKGRENIIDFQGATLPDGRSIENILNENEKLKKDVVKLKINLEESSSILTKVIPNKKLRNIVEIILILLTVLGIVTFL